MRTLLAVIALSLSTVAGSHSASADTSSDLGTILDHVDDLYADKASHSKMAMHVVTEHATRDLSMETWTKGRDRILVRILSPEKEAGTSTLKSGNNVWNYFPKINQVTKLSASLMSAAWMGSHVTNSEIVKHTRMSENYTYTKTFDGDRNGEKQMDLSLDPKPNAPVVWGKVIVTVRTSDQNPVVIKYFDEGKALSQTWTFTEVKKLGGRNLPTTVKVVPAGKPTESTEIRYQSIQFNPTLDEDLFSQRALSKS